MPIPELLIAILAGQQRVLSEDFEYAPDTVRCELGLWHEGEHAAFVWDWERRKPEEGLWARWTPDGAMRFESLPWCGVEGGVDGDACTLYRDHAREHSWDVVDPATAALRRRVLADTARLLLLPTKEPNNPPS
ncbi:hypothetical protein [Streptomyces chartreusis]|uniref:hypothetical protein n=1 Tax=Streptomyces chartreusis TaxID=1969 RepID=UPI0038128EF6